VYRPELILEVRNKPLNKNQRMTDIYQILDSIDIGRAIVYNATCKECDEMIIQLANHYGVALVGKYHGKMPSTEQKETLKLWKDGNIRFMVATNAFGMGINVDNVRVIIHTTIPMSMDQYVQEIG
jgi:ATP-dependent DNA helicase RecQ